MGHIESPRGGLLSERQARDSYFPDLSLAAMRRWRRERRGPVFVRLGTRVFYLAADVESYIESRRVQTAERSRSITPALINKESGREVTPTK